MCPKVMAEKDADYTEERATEVREHLANERTLLSWVRTGIGLISTLFDQTYKEHYRNFTPQAARTSPYTVRTATL